MPSHSSPTHFLPLSRIFKQIGAELRIMEESLGAVATMIDRIVADPRLRDDTMMRDMQNIDLLGQSLLALADYSEILSTVVPDDWQADTDSASKSLKLSELAQRLRLVQGCKSVGMGSISSELEML